MYEYTLRKTRDVDFFSSPHYDAVSTAPIVDGDTICICDRCGAIHLQSSWDANDRQCASCEGKKRKNFDEAFLHRYRVTPKKGAGRGRTETPSVGARRRTGVSVGSYKATGPQTVIPGRRRVAAPLPAASSITTEPPVAVSFNAERLTADSRRHVTTELLPRNRAQRKRAGKILLGCLIGLIAASVIICLAMI